MSNYDPKEMVKFGNREVSLWTAVRDILRQPAVTRTGIAVFRQQGKEPSFLETADIERIAQLPAFKDPQRWIVTYYRGDDRFRRRGSLAFGSLGGPG